jgi:hypothetical protein
LDARLFAMRRIADLAGQELVWLQPARMQQAFELRASDEVVATLRFEGACAAAAAAATG